MTFDTNVINIVNSETFLNSVEIDTLLFLLFFTTLQVIQYCWCWWQ